MGNKFMRRMVTLLITAAMIMTSGVFAFAASSPTAGKVTWLSSEGSNGGKKITVQWKADKDADYYIVKVGSKTPKKVYGTKTTFTTTAGAKYKVTVTPVYGKKEGTAKTQLRWMKGTSITSVKAAGSKKLTIKWKKASGATKYKVYQYKNGKYSYVKTVTGTKATVKVAKKGSYKFKVRPMKGSYLGMISGAKSGKAK